MNKLKGLILKTQTYRESSRLLQTYTEKGKITLMARGAERLNSNDRILAQYLTEIEFGYTNFKDFMTLKQAKLLNDYDSIKTDYHKVKDASLILEIITRTAFGDENHQAIYNLAIESLNYHNIKVSSYSFALKILYYLGFGIALKGDGRIIKGVNIEQGRIVYEDELESVILNLDEAVQLLQITYTKTNELKEFDNNFLEKLKIFIKKYYEYHLNISLKALN